MCVCVCSSSLCSRVRVCASRSWPTTVVCVDQALNRTGRQMNYMCNFPWQLWGMHGNAAMGGAWTAEFCNSWRTCEPLSFYVCVRVRVRVRVRARVCGSWRSCESLSLCLFVGGDPGPGFGSSVGYVDCWERWADAIPSG